MKETVQVKEMENNYREINWLEKDNRSEGKSNNLNKTPKLDTIFPKLYKGGKLVSINPHQQLEKVRFVHCTQKSKC